jgi:hypothetical protein
MRYVRRSHSLASILSSILLFFLNYNNMGKLLNMPAYHAPPHKAHAPISEGQFWGKNKFKAVNY